jgi:Carboxypeptidase regulatory-like domain/TonB dependent receptor
MKARICLLALLLFTAGWAQGQGVGSSGTVTGTVVDSSGALMPKVTVSVVDTETGLKREAVTDVGGQYRVTGLSPSTYEVSAAATGFATELRRNLTVAIGQTVVSDFRMNPSQVASVVEVMAEPPTIETERGSQADRINQQYIADLPIDRRDYLTFTLLAPGVSDSTRLADDQDYRVKQTPQSGLSFYGSNGRGNSITVDGGETGDDTGGVRLTVSQDGVQEFQINRSNYAADLGAATGGSINIVTKSGTNQIHGTLFGFFRNDAMDARDPFAFSQALAPGETFNPAAPDSVGSPVKNTLSRQQFGGAIGFPVKKDKTFVFAAFEGLRQDAENSVPILTNTNVFRPTLAQSAVLAGLTGGSTVPCLSGPVGAAVAAHLGLPAPNPTTNLPAVACAAILNGTLTIDPAISPLDAFLLNQFETGGGVFPYTTREYLASGRLDHRFNTHNEFSLTYRYGHDLEESPDVQSLTAFSAGSSIHNYDNNLQASWYHQFSGSLQNEARVQWDYNSFRVLPNEPGQVGLQIPGFINNLGTNIFLPNISILRRYELADNLTKVRGRHTIQVGIDEILRGNHTESHTFFPGRFVFGPLPGLLLSPLLSSLTSLQLASFGVPEFYQQGFGNPTYPYYTRPLTGIYGQDSWKITPSFTLNYGLRYELDSQYLPLTTYTKDFAPRVSFAWDPFKDHKTVIRGGYGIFYGPVDEQIPAVDLSLGAVNRNKSAVENGAGPSQVANLTATCGMSQFGIPLVHGSGSSPCNREISIYADAAGIPPLAPGLPPTAGAATIFQTLFAEGLIQCTTPAAGNAACITPGAVANFGANGVGIDVANSGPVTPLQVLFVNQPGYRPPIAQQASFGIERTIGPGFSISASGIYTHTQRLPVAIDTNLLPAPFSTVRLANGQTVSYRNWNGGTPGNPSLADPLGGTEFPNGLSPCANPAACFVNPLIVQNNQYSSEAYALYEGGIVEIKKHFSDHFTLFGNYTFSRATDTSTDFNSDYGPQDPTNINIDRSLSEFDERHKVVLAAVIDSPWKQKILSGFQFSPIVSYHSGHPFNLLAGGEVNGDNHTTNERPIGAPRDTGLGPNYVDFDGRLTWLQKIGDKASVQFTAEGFNIANRTNFASVNNEVSPVFGLTPGFATFNVHGIRPGTAIASGGVATPSTPLAFTSAFPMREIQLGLRFSF